MFFPNVCPGLDRMRDRAAYYGCTFPGRGTRPGCESGRHHAPVGYVSQARRRHRVGRRTRGGRSCQPPVRPAAGWRFQQVSILQRRKAQGHHAPLWRGLVPRRTGRSGRHPARHPAAGPVPPAAQGCPAAATPLGPGEGISPASPRPGPRGRRRFQPRTSPWPGLPDRQARDQAG